MTDEPKLLTGEPGAADAPVAAGDAASAPAEPAAAAAPVASDAPGAGASTTIPPAVGPPGVGSSAPSYGPGAPRPVTETPEPDLWDRCATWAMDRGAVHAMFLITFTMIVIYAHMFAGELAGDDLTFHMAESVRIADCLRAGDFDLWNPSGNGGFASAYYYQVVPQLVSAIPAAMFGHHVFFFQLSVFLPLVLAPAAAYRGMRLLGATPWQAVVAALAVGFLNGESRWGTGNAGTFNVGLYTQTWALAAFPIALGHAVRWASDARGLAPAIAWGAFITLCHPFAGVALGVALLFGWLAQLVLAAVDIGLRALGGVMTGDPQRNLAMTAFVALGKRWRNLPPRPWRGELARLAVLAAGLGLAWMPIWLPLAIDYAGFGGFPHRVSDEVGPGIRTLWTWYSHGGILDFNRPVVLTWALPSVALLARTRFLRWLWAPAVIYAVWLALGPVLGKTDDDLIPAVRFLGAMQIVLALAIGAGFLVLCKRIWDAPDGSPVSRGGRLLIIAGGLAIAAALGYLVLAAPETASVFVVAQRFVLEVLSLGGVRWLVFAGLVAGTAALTWLAWPALRSQFAVRTGIAAGAAVLGVLLTIPGARALGMRVNVLSDFPGSHGDELHAITRVLQSQPAGRKQVAAGAENHWWNLLSYEYGRRPATLMMGGGGLQASPNYDFLWSNAKDYLRNAWVYDAPLLVVQKSSAGTIAGSEPVFETKNYAVRRLPAPGLVSPVEVTGALPTGNKQAVRTAALAWYRSDDALKDRVLSYPGPAGASGGLTAAPQGKVLRAVRQDSPGDAPDIVAEVTATAPTTFMARESWHPRWLATIDGAPAPIRRVTPSFLAVDVPAGHHTLGFRFHRPWWAHAAWLAWLLVPLLAWRITRRRARADARPV